MIVLVSELAVVSDTTRNTLQHIYFTFKHFEIWFFYVGIKHWGLGPLHLVIVYRKLAIYVELVQAKVWQSLGFIIDDF